MNPCHLFMDERLTGMCVYCGAHPETRDHVPSKVLLDKPYRDRMLVPMRIYFDRYRRGKSYDEVSIIED